MQRSSRCSSLPTDAIASFAFKAAIRRAFLSIGSSPTSPISNCLSCYGKAPAKTYTEEALDTLVDVARNGRTDAARVSAANALLDRAYGKPAVKEERETVDLPPVVIQLTGPSR